ncbi:hypothetical protein QBC34DRAFT_403408 [Podospora aff. communis PSN243]|uniref:Secreted protein n=1 Tax=Podospora aff. communis PSN243 TaxID=3040156 RepID=A0AAV9GQN6_9PEZI|nr:hypothetical protein QBC34DRAFT_403408 [Podospora aff. communis PSN243]
MRSWCRRFILFSTASSPRVSYHFSFFVLCAFPVFSDDARAWPRQRTRSQCLAVTDQQLPSLCCAAELVHVSWHRFETFILPYGTSASSTPTSWHASNKLFRSPEHLSTRVETCRAGRTLLTGVRQRIGLGSLVK